MKFKEWLRVDEAVPRNAGSAIHIPANYEISSNPHELDRYKKGLEPWAHVRKAWSVFARTGVGNRFNDLLSKAGHEPLTPTDMDALEDNQNKQKIVVVGIPLQTCLRMGDGSFGVNFGKNFATMYSNIVNAMQSGSLDRFILTPEDLRSGQRNNKFDIPRNNDAADTEHAQNFTKALAHVKAFEKFLSDPKSKGYESVKMKLMGQKEEGGIVWYSFAFPKKNQEKK